MSTHIAAGDDDLPPPSAQRAAGDESGDAQVSMTSTSAATPIGRLWERSGDVCRGKVMVATRSVTDALTDENPRGVVDQNSSTSLSVQSMRVAHEQARIPSSSHPPMKPCPSPFPSTATTTATKTTATTTKPYESTNNPLTSPTAVRTFFDPWNSSSTGHQRAENRLSGSTSWRQSRNTKLTEQYKGGLTGGKKRVADTVGAGSEGFGKDGRKANGGWERGAKGLRNGGQTSLVDVWGIKKELGRDLQEEKLEEVEVDETVQMEEDTSPEYDTELPSESQEKQIFKGLCFHLNGSTAPRISDHQLKHLLSLHGGSHSIALARRTVTHVILGTTCGGGLAASKIQKEIEKSKSKGIKFVNADWVLSSIKVQRRLPESSYSPLPLKPKTQNGLLGMMISKSAKPAGG